MSSSTALYVFENFMIAVFFIFLLLLLRSVEVCLCMVTLVDNYSEDIYDIILFLLNSRLLKFLPHALEFLGGFVSLTSKLRFITERSDKGYPIIECLMTMASIMWSSLHRYQVTSYGSCAFKSFEKICIRV